MRPRRTGVMLLAAALLTAGCVDGDAPRSARAIPAAPTAQRTRVAPPGPDERPNEGLEDPDPATRRESVYAIADAEGPDRAANIGQALTDPDPGVRTAAVEAMTGVDDGTAADWLATGLGDPDPRVRRAAVEALGQVGGTSARFLLEQSLADADAGVREAAQQMLAEPAFAGEGVSPAFP